MRHRRGPNRRSWYFAFLAFTSGIVIGWWLRGGPPRPATAITQAPADTQSQSGALRSDSEAPLQQPGAPQSELDAAREPTIAPAPLSAAGAVDELTRRDLRMPIDNASANQWKGMFAEGRDGNGRPHEAVDILAPRNTPVHAVEEGTIAKLFYSKAGGRTVYEFDRGQRFCYYYAHLDRYMAGLEMGQHVARGEVIGYVGTSGNAPPDTPHLHFAIFALSADRRWWQGQPLDPYSVFTHSP